MLSQTKIYFFKFQDKSAKWFAFRQMYEARFALKKFKGITFFKLMGSGSGQGFSLWPDFSTYSLLVTFKDLQAKKDFENSNWFINYNHKAAYMASATLHAFKGHGTWKKQQPFPIESSNHKLKPICVLTRATIKPFLAPIFWLFVSAVSKAVWRQKKLIYAKGIGTKPFLELATFSIWKNEEAIESFAYRKNPHREAVVKTRKMKWFKEELFMRFSFEPDYLHDWVHFIPKEKMHLLTPKYSVFKVIS